MDNSAETPDSASLFDPTRPLPVRLQAGLRRVQSRLTDLGPRVASSLILIFGALASLVLGPVIFLMIWLAAALRIHWEWQRLIGGGHRNRRVAVGALALVAATALIAATGSLQLAIAILLLAAVVAGIGDAGGFRLWAAAGIVYAGSLIISLGMLRLSLPFGVRAIAWLFAVVWGTDVVAYFAGRLVGGPKFLPRISPSKTWSGTLTGIFGGAALGTLFLGSTAGLSGGPSTVSLAALFLLGIAVAMIAQAGDLFESWAKRRFGVKDSGGLIPGHGGMMDRLDGFIAAAAFLALLGWIGGIPSAAQSLFSWI